MKERTQFNYAQRWRIEHSGPKRSTQKRARSAIVLTLLSFILFSVLALPWIWQFVLDHNLTKIEERIVYYQEVAVTLENIDRLEKEIEGKNNFLEVVKGRAKDPREVLTQISTLLPTGTTVTSFALQADNSVQIGLVIPGPVDLAKLWINFSNSGMFTGFDLQSVSLVDQAQTHTLTLKMK
jgi:hypothetical protein